MANKILNPQHANQTNDNMKKVFQLLEQGEQIVSRTPFGDKLQNVTLVLGNTGAGKSTFTRWITGNDESLLSIPDETTPGEFAIIDPTSNTTINTVTTSSTTTFPELVVDKNTKAAYFDFPGFKDTRGVAYDIALSYFIKKVIDSVERIKIIFVVKYDSVTSKAVRDDFTGLIRHVTKFVTNIDKLKDSIALVATRVQNNISYERTLGGIADFMIKARNELVNQEVNENVDHADEKKLIDALLSKAGNTYSKIGIFRSPDQEGSLKNISSLQENKKHIAVMLKKLNFVAKHNSDFGYTVPKSSLSDVANILNDVNKSIIDNIEESGKQVQGYFSTREDQFQDIFQLYNEMGLLYYKFVEISEEANKHQKPEECLQKLVSGIASIGINNGHFSNGNSFLSNALKYGNYSLFLRTVSNYQMDDLFQCAEGMNDTIDYINKSKKWYQFLIELYNKLSDYVEQKNIKSPACISLASNPDQNTRNSRKLSDVIHSISEECQLKTGIDFQDISNLILDRKKLNALRRVLNSTVKHDTNISCDSNTLMMKGWYIFLSHIQNALKSNCNVPPKFIQIFALDKIFVDTDLNLTGQNVHLSMLSPTWDIRGDHSIILDGANGVAHNLQKAPSGRIAEQNGKNGEPGLPGGSGGNFLGIGEIFINLVGLTVSSSGGHGAPGQHGGDGAEGNLGIDAQNDLTSDGKSKDFKIRSSSKKGSESTYILAGKSGTRGGNGGDGGKGGKGGYPGNITLISLSSFHHNAILKTEATFGKDGSGGIGGKGGLGGEFGNDIQIKIKPSWFPWNYYEDQKVLHTNSSMRGPSGELGIENANSMRMELPMPNDLSSDRFNIVSTYKAYLRENLYHNVRESKLSKFLHEIEHNSLIKDLYPTEGFLNDLKNLETQYYKLRKISLLPFYQSLLNRIEEFISKNINNANFKDHRVLHYLCIATLSRICTIKYDLENYIIVDIDGYFPSAKKHIELYREQLDKMKIETYREQYQSTINEQILEARQIIQKSILPEVNQIFDEIDDEIHLMIQNIINQHRLETKKYRNKLVKQLPLTAIMGVLKFVVQCIAGLNVVSKTAAAVAGLVINAVEDIVLSPKPKAEAFYDVLKTTGKALLNRYLSEQKSLKQFFDEEKMNPLGQNLTESDEITRNIFRIVESFKSLLGQASVKENEYLNEKASTKTELRKYHQEMEKQKVQLQTNQPESDPEKPNKIEKIHSKIKWVTHIRTIINLAEASTDLLNKFQSQDGTMSTIGENIDQIEDQITRIKMYEENLRNILIPSITKMEVKVLDTMEKSSNKSHIELDIKKWQMGDFFKEFQSEMANMIRESSDNSTLNNKLVRCVDRLHDGMMTTFQIYDRIQDYQDQAKLANYITGLSSGPKSMGNESPELSKDLNDLELTIKSNLVLQEYEKALGTFKQYIFPFAKNYPNLFDVSPFLKPSNRSDLVTTAVNRIDELRDAVIKKATAIETIKDSVFQNLRYHIGNSDEQPFLTWSNATYKEEISKLLRGKAITMKADITEGIAKNAIKFREIGIRFITKNQTTQRLLDQQLNNFNVKLTHLGDSHYRCNDKYYIFNHNIISMQHAVNINETQIEPHYRYADTTTDLIRKNEPIFSPYATWKIQLKSKVSNDETEFARFAEFFNQTMDLALEGYGGHIDFPALECNENLENFYKLDTTISRLHLSSNDQDTFNHHRIRRRTENGSNNTKQDSTQFARSSAGRVKPPMQSAIDFMGNIVGHWSLFYVPIMTNYDFIKTSFQSIFMESKQVHFHSTKNNGPITSPAEFNVNESLTLADFFIRWVTKAKPYNSCTHKSVNFPEVRASVLNIIAEFEEVLKDLSIRYNLPDDFLEFDPIVLMPKLEKVVINRRHDEIGKILYESVICQKILDSTRVGNDLRARINEMHRDEKEDELFKQLPDIKNNNLGVTNMSNVIRTENCIDCTSYNSKMNYLPSLIE